jgi:hypothetical protein
MTGLQTRTTHMPLPCGLARTLVRHARQPEVARKQWKVNARPKQAGPMAQDHERGHSCVSEGPGDDDH